MSRTAFEIRPWRPGDERDTWSVLREVSLGNVSSSFRILLRRPLTVAALVGATSIAACSRSLLEAALTGVGCVGALYLLALAASLYYLYGPPLGDMADVRSEYFSRSDTHFWVAVVGERIVGTISIVRSPTRGAADRDCERKTAWLRRMTVLPEYRRLGVASALVSVTLDFCRQQNYAAVELITTEIHEPARNLYTKMGFECRSYKPYHYLKGLVTVWTYEFVYYF